VIHTQLISSKQGRSAISFLAGPRGLRGSMAIFFNVSPFVASLFRVLMFTRTSHTAWGLGGLIGWNVGSLITVAIGIVMLARERRG